VRNPQAQDPDISRRGDVQKMRVERQNLRGYPILVAAKKGVAGQIMVQGKCRWTSFNLHRRERSPMIDLCARAAVNTQERKLPAAGKGGELAAQRGDSVGFAEAIGEESHAKRRCQ
jgi:hypothetical protein